MQLKSFFLLCFLFLAALSLSAQTVLFSGEVKAKDSKDPLIGANVYLKGTTIGTATNAKGQFSIRNVKPGAYELVVSYSGYHKIMRNIEVKLENTCINFEMEKSDKVLGEVVVTGTGTPHHLKSAPVLTELISKKLVKAVAASGFADLMTSVSPSFDFNPNNMGSFMQLNGLSSDYILVLVDGKRMYGDVGGQSDVNRINPDDIEKIEVVKGASSSLYGSEAIAGVINVITKKSKRKIYAETNNRFSEYGTKQYHNKIGMNLGRFSSLTSYSIKESNGWQLSQYEIDDDMDNDDPSDDVLVKTDAKKVNAYDDFTIRQRLDFAVTDKLSVYALASKYEKNLLIPQTVKKYGYYFDDLSYSSGAKYRINKKDYVTVDFNSDQYKYYYKYNQDDISSKSGKLIHSKDEKLLNTKQKREDLNLKYILNFTKAHQITVGGEYVNESLESDGRLTSPRETASTFSGYAQDVLKLVDNLTLVVGARYVKHKEFGNAFTPKLSVLYKLHDFNFRASFAKGFKAPTVKELYYRYQKGKKLYLGNVNLDPQKSDYYSFSVEYIIPKLSLSLSAYQNKIDAMIAYKTVPTTPEDSADGVKTTRKHFNIGEAKTTGIDFLFNVNVGAGFAIGGGYSYVDAKNETEDINLEGVAHNYANFRVLYDKDWKGYSLNLNLTGRIQDEKFYDGEANAKAYNLWKLTSSHCFSTGGTSLEITAGVDNIFDDVDDRPYGSHYASLSPGRTVFMGVNIRFAK